MDPIYFTVRNVSVAYKTFMISKVSFTLQSGSILGLMGRSGSGKSTLIQALVGLKSYKGDITLTFKGSSYETKDIMGYSPQENALFPLLTLEENIKTFGQLYHIEPERIASRMKELLKRFDLTRARKKKIIELSGGMQKRADLAVALIHDPKVIILDEPFTGLDVSLQKFIWDMLKELAQEGKIIIVASHIIEDLEEHCTEFGLLHNNTYFGTQAIMQNKKRANLRKFAESIFMEELKSV
jgi:ABC-2 type transport system ATP-binding protein